MELCVSTHRCSKLESKETHFFALQEVALVAVSAVSTGKAPETNCFMRVCRVPQHGKKTKGPEFNAFPATIAPSFLRFVTAMSLRQH